MLLDLLLIVIVVISAVCYARAGLVKTVISLIQWMSSVVLGLLFCHPLAEVARGSGLGVSIESGIEEKISGTIGESHIVKAIPGVFAGAAEDAADFVAEEMAERIMTIVLTILSFMLVILIVKIVLFLVFHLFSKKYQDGIVGGIDGTAGFILGIALGCLYALIFLALMVLLIDIFPDNISIMLHNSLEDSIFSGYLYDNNPLLIGIKTLFG